MLQLIMFNIFASLKRFTKDERGISALEYAVLAAVVLVAIAIALGLFAADIGDWFSDAADAVEAEFN